MVTNLLEQTEKYCIHWHHGQKRKYTNEPYHTHPQAVCAILKAYGVEDEEVLAAALLHDVVEDCGVKEQELKDLFGDRVAKLVMEVTDVSLPIHGNRAKRKEMDREHLAKASDRGKLIKCADTLHNTSSIVAHDKNFANVYIKEKLALMPLIRVDHHLWYVTNSIINECADRLEIKKDRV